MRRVLASRRRLVVSAALGLAVSVGVAWGVEAFAPVRAVASPTPLVYSWLFDPPEGWPIGPVRSGEARSAWRVHEIAQGNVPEGGASQARTRVGWPLLTMEHRRAVTHDGNFTVTARHDTWLDRGLALPDAMQSYSLPERRLPLRPLWGGLALSTVLYGSVAFVLLTIPRVLVVRSRRRRGHCPVCGYDVRRGASCPECGWAGP